MAVAYVEIDGVPGESTNDAHKNWIEIEDISHSMQQRGSQSAGTGTMVADRAGSSPYRIWKRIDKSSPILMEHCLAGDHLKKLKIEMVRVSNGQTETYMEVNLEDAIVTDVQVNVNGKGDVGEWVSFLPQKIKWNYTAHKNGKAQGNTPGGWDYSIDKKYT